MDMVLFIVIRNGVYYNEKNFYFDDTWDFFNKLF